MKDRHVTRMFNDRESVGNQDKIELNSADMVQRIQSVNKENIVDGKDASMMCINV